MQNYLQQKQLFKSLALLVLSLAWVVPLQASEAYSEGGTQQCLGCHDFSKDSPVHPMMEGAHGDPDNPDTPMAQKGCEQCHGPSAAHTLSPTKNKPGISFGPRWTDSVSQQSNACLQCHQEDKVHDWPSAVHQRNNLTCATCHDLHVTDQAVLNPSGQAEVCTVCHKVQKQGVHHLAEEKANNPPCSTCHDPHADPSAVVKLLQNRSEGCRECHDFRAMQKSPQVSDRAKQYHKAMANKDKTCIDCHQGVTHSPPNSFPPPVLGGLTAAEIVLFTPGQSDFEWIISEHAGAQSFRQGRNCLQCHRGDEAEMGAKLGSPGAASSIAASIEFALQNNNLAVTVSWPGSADDSAVALMFDDNSNETFASAGCWASCHSDLPGMTQDSGQQLSKYLTSSREQQRSIGRLPQVRDEATLKQMMEDDLYVELWLAKLSGGSLQSVDSLSILDQRRTDPQAVVSASASFNKGRWSVTFIKPLSGSGKGISKGKIYTFGLSLFGEGKQAAQHWVSLPMTFSLDDIDSNFTVAQ